MLISLTTKSFALLVDIILSLKLSKMASFSLCDLGLLVRDEEMVVARVFGIWPIETIDENRVLNALAVDCVGCTGADDAAGVDGCVFDATVVLMISIAAFYTVNTVNQSIIHIYTLSSILLY